MEKSVDRYLHKKFKKQLSIEPTFQNADKEEKGPVSSVVQAESLQRQNACVLKEKTSTILCDNVPVKNSNESVPKFSTNNENLTTTTNFKVTAPESSKVAKSSISRLEQNDDSNLDVREKNRQEAGREFVDQQSSNDCISYVILKSSTHQNAQNIRAVNFDKRFNVSEPISSIPTAEASSILDNSYSKQYVTSKLVNLDNAGDISSNVSLANDDHLASTATTPISLTATQDDTTDHKPSSESKPENTSECQNVEKSSGGKYICSYCNLACSKPSVLQKHIRAHTNERPYPCVSCGFSFKTRSNLYKHCRSRTHANRVMGNKAQEMNNEALDTDSQSKMECDQTTSTESGGEDCTIINHQEKTQTVDIKTKPYKPRFHTAKAFYDIQKECEDQKVPETLQNRPSNSDLLSLHINEVISKNNAIVNSESYLIKKRSMESCENSVLGEGPAFYPHVASDERHNDEPLNLTNKSRKRCLSEVAEPTMHTSLIKELLLKNLYADSMQCPHCKMIFQTVTELELHKLRSCKGHTKTGARYSRSSSVNVASILTKNKNAFDNIPYLQNTTFPMKSPGPFLGNTRLVESDKNKSFSFDDNLPTFQNNLQNPNELLKASLRYSVSPLTIQHDKAKKPPVKMFGGQVKITQSTGESKSFKIDNEEGEKFGNGHFADYSGRLSENRVVKSSLQSGGTVLQNKTNYNLKQEVSRSSPNVIHVYENSALSPSVEMVNMEKGKFSYDRQGNYDLENENKLKGDLLVRPPSDTIGSPNFNNIASTPYEYTSIMDFSQKAVKLLAPNLKQPNLSIPGVPMPKISSKLLLPRSPSDIKQELSSKIYEAARRPIDTERTDLTREPEARHMENIQFAQKQILLHQRLAAEPQIQSPNMCNPVNLFVNGKVVRYVPGIPGPVAADVPINVGYGVNNNRIPSSSFRPQKSNMRLNPSDKSSIPIDLDKSETKYAYYNNHRLQSPEKKYGSEQIEPIPKSPKLPLEIKTTNDNFLEMRSASVKSCELKSPAPKSPIPICSISESPRKFARPNTLALKPSIAAQKQHHGLTPTMFNQILISPDTPRNAKKYIQHFLHGNYFSYLGLKSSTKSVYCTLNKTQPFYVPHFKKLSMYSEWRQQDTKGDKLYVSGYDSRQRQLKYTTAGKATGDLVVHSSYKFVVTETCSIKGDDQGKSNQILGGYESTEDYTYVRGRGRGRYVCDQCGIRCKKPSMLKKHIRTHTNDRPFTCSHCNFSFKTKGNLTKHMKSKAHTKNYAASSSSSSSTQQSGTQSSDTDTDDSGMDSSDESTRQQEHEAAYGLLSLSQKTTQVVTSNLSPVSSLGLNPIDNQISFMNTEQVTQVNNSNFAKNKILDKQIILNFIASKIGNEIPSSDTPASKETQNLIRFLGKSNTSRPLTYPYTSDMVDDNEKLTNKINPSVSPASISNYESTNSLESKLVVEQRSNFSVVQKHNVHYTPPECFSSKTSENRRITIPITISYDPSYLETYKGPEDNLQDRRSVSPLRPITPVVKINDRVVLNNVPYNNANDLRKRKVHENDYNNAAKLHRMNSDGEAIDLSMPSLIEKSISPEMSAMRYNGMSPSKENELRMSNLHITEPRGNLRNESTLINDRLKLAYKGTNDGAYKHNGAPPSEIHEAPFFNRESENVINLKTTISPNHLDSDQHININYVIQENSPSVITTFTEVPNSFSPMDYDNSAMETLADIATKQVKLEKNTLAKSVASEYLKLATKHEFQCNDGIRETNNFSAAKDLNELIVKPEENRSCTVCSKNFSKPSQLRLHMNIHYIERPFRCDPCSVSFRTKGHLQKHERSASHHNKLSSSPLSSSSEPRPFKCSDCNIAFRIHGHLAKHLRSKMHIMKLECLAKVPFGLYAELERANSLLTEINTTDGDQCLESLKALARKVFMNDPSKLNQLEVSLNSTDASDS